jgi:hypothetical protein
VSLWIESEGECALITGDFLHHPVQCERPEWREVGDHDPEQARATRRRMLTCAANTGALVMAPTSARTPSAASASNATHGGSSPPEPSPITPPERARGQAPG